MSSGMTRRSPTGGNGWFVTRFRLLTALDEYKPGDRVERIGGALGTGKQMIGTVQDPSDDGAFVRIRWDGRHYTSASVAAGMFPSSIRKHTPPEVEEPAEVVEDWEKALYQTAPPAAGKTLTVADIFKSLNPDPEPDPWADMVAVLRDYAEKAETQAGHLYTSAEAAKRVRRLSRKDWCPGCLT